MWIVPKEKPKDKLNRIIGTEEQDRADLWPLLSKAVYASFALLQPVRVPRQVIVEDRIEPLLKINLNPPLLQGMLRIRGHSPRRLCFVRHLTSPSALAVYSQNCRETLAAQDGDCCGRRTED